MKKDCISGKIEVDVTKKKQVKRTQKPFENIIRKFSLELEKTPWFEMDDAWIEKVKFVQKYEKIEEETIAQEIADYYSKYGDLSPSQVKRACIIYPDVDKYIQKKFEVDLFSCKDILNKYPVSSCTDDSIRISNSAFDGEKPIKQICENGRWRKIRKNEDEMGVCNDSRKGKVVGIYVCDSVWRFIAFMELPETPCENDVEVQSKYYPKLSYKCTNGRWIAKIRDEQLLIDTRDWNYYKIRQIGDQVWMAENLNYADSLNCPSMKGRSWCYNNELDSCAKYGRLYTWAAAMDSAGTFSTNGKNCGYNNDCSPAYPVRGICPEGWHLPDTTAWRTLYETVGGTPPEAWNTLKSRAGFSALPAGYYGDYCFSDAGYSAHFWSATEYNSRGAYDTYLNLGYTELSHTNKGYGQAVRCLQDSQR